MDQPYYASCVPAQPLDKISLQICYLYSFPSYLQFIIPFVNVFQSMDFRDENSIKIFEINYHLLLSFLQKCCEIYLSNEKPDCDIEQKTKIDNITLGFAYHKAQNEYSLTLEENQTILNFNHRLIPILMSAVRKLLFKSYGYTHNINYLINQYIKAAPITLIQSPTYQACTELFGQFEAPFIDFFLFFEIIERHKRVLKYLKLFDAFQK